MTVVALISGEASELYWGERALIGLVYLGVIASAVAFTLYYWLLRRTSVVTVASIIYMTLIVAVVCEWLIYGTVIKWGAGFGMILIFLGLTLTESPKYRAQLKRRASTETASLGRP